MGRQRDYQSGLYGELEKLNKKIRQPFKRK